MKLINDRIVYAKDSVTLLNTHFRKALQLVCRQPLVSQTNGPGTLVCLTSLTDLKHNFFEKLDIMKRLEDHTISLKTLKAEIAVG